jgi:transposase-like protein
MAERAVGGDLPTFLAGQRAEGASYSAIASVLQEHNILLTYETVRRWCQYLGVEVKAS